MALKDLNGKTVYDLEDEDFDLLFCRQCREYPACSRHEKKILVCKVLLDSGLWDSFYRKLQIEWQKGGD